MSLETKHTSEIEERLAKRAEMKIVESTEREVIQYDSMEEMVRDYVKLKELINRLETAKKTLNEQMKKGLAAFGIDALQIKLEDNHYQIKQVVRPYHSCNWESLKNLHPDIYAAFVVDSESTFVDVRQVKDPSEKSDSSKKKSVKNRRLKAVS